jgi:hypothetical protein
LSVRWFLGYDLNEPLPDHSSLTRIRERYGLGIFRRFFERIVELCVEAGLVWGKELYFDATKVRANADVDRLRSRSIAENHLKELFEEAGGSEKVEDFTEPHLSPAMRGPPMRCPQPGTRPSKRTMLRRRARTGSPATVGRIAPSVRGRARGPPSAG